MKISPFVVTVMGLLSPTGIVTTFVPQTSTPFWDVTICPSARVVVMAGEETPIVEVLTII